MFLVCRILDCRQFHRILRCIILHCRDYHLSFFEFRILEKPKKSFASNGLDMFAEEMDMFTEHVDVSKNLVVTEFLIFKKNASQNDNVWDRD